MNFTTGGAVYSSPAVANGVVYVGSEDANIYGLNAATGAELLELRDGRCCGVLARRGQRRGLRWLGR